MKHSDINHTEKTFGILLNNKKLALSDHSMTISSSNSVLFVSAISTQMNQNSSILSTALNTPRSKTAVPMKGNSISTPTVNANLTNQLTYISPNNNTIKLVNLSKCQHFQSVSKDNCNVMTNNAINVQFVTPIVNNFANASNDNKISKIDNNCISNSAVVLAGPSNQLMSTSNSSITCTRFILHGSQAPVLPHGIVTIIPQNSDLSANSNLIKNTKYTLTGMKQTLQAIRPITTCTTAVTSPSLISGKQSLSKIPPSISLNNYSINMSDDNHNIAIQDLTNNRHKPILKEPHRIISKTTPMVTITSSNNIRLALTSNISNSKVNANGSKIQLISSKSRIRSGSPINCTNDGKLNDSLNGIKDENTEHPDPYNNLGGCYSPTRKRARKQHLKAVTNKLQKLASNGKYDTFTVINNTTNYCQNDSKPFSTPIPIAPTTAKPTEQVAANIISLKNPIQIVTSKISNLGSFYPSSNGKVKQVQIINQTRPLTQNLILSPTLGPRIANISPPKVIHIGQTKIGDVKSEKLLSCVTTLGENVKNQKNYVKETMKLDVAEIKSEASEESNGKYSLFPNKSHWNPRRTHFEKESDVKVKRSLSSVLKSNSENSEDMSCTNDSEIFDTSWCLYKASTQFLKQKYFDEENLRNFQKLKEKFDIKSSNKDEDNEPIFQKNCLSTLQFHQLPDQFDFGSLSEFTDPGQFGIAADIINTHINTIVKDHCADIPSDPNVHNCTDSCVFYLSQVPTMTQPPHILRVIDLIEGLIVKERKIIEKESEINSQCLRLLESSDCVPLVTKHKNHNQIDCVKIQNGRRS